MNHAQAEMNKAADKVVKKGLVPARIVLLLMLFLTALGIRLYNLNEFPRDFWTVRQYRGALLARAFFFHDNESIPEWRRVVAEANRPAFREPPVLEWLAAAGYRWVGRECFGIPRAITALAWLLGGGFLFAIARRWMTFDAAFTAAAFYLLLPYGIVASRCFQPDPLMVCGLLAAVHAILRHHERPQPFRLFLCMGISALAILLKPGVTQFSILLIFLSLAWRREGVKGIYKRLSVWVFLAGALLPSVVYSVWTLTADSDMASHIQFDSIPRWLLTLYFWKGWAGILVHIFTAVGLVAGMSGLMMARGSGLVLTAAWSAGYFIQCLFTSYTTPTHDYWHMQVIPLVSLGIGFASMKMWEIGRIRSSFRAKAIIYLSMALLVAWSIARDPLLSRKAVRNDYEPLAREIGRLTGHSTNVVYLDYDFGASLCYFAEIAGHYWPESRVMRFRQLEGRAEGLFDPQQTAIKRFEMNYARYAPDFFVICRAVHELDEQPGLKEFLFSRHVPMAVNDRYVIIDLNNGKRADP